MAPSAIAASVLCLLVMVSASLVPLAGEVVNRMCAGAVNMA